MKSEASPAPVRGDTPPATRRRASRPGAGAASVAVVAGLVVGGCGEAPRRVAYDLAADAHLSRQVHPGGERSYVTSPETVYSTIGNPAKQQPPRLVSNAILQWSERGPRRVWLDVERPGWGSGEVAVMLNHTPVGTLSLEPGRGWYGVSLPAAAERRGVNRLRLDFTAGESAELPPPAGPPGRLHGLRIGSPDAPEPLSTLDGRGDEKEPTLTLAAGTGLEFGIHLPESAELAFAPRVPAGAAGPAVFRVELSTDGQPTRNLARIERAAGEASKRVRVPIPGDTGATALLGLYVDGPAEGRVVGEWVAPVVQGRPEPPPPAEPAQALERVERLRHDLESRSVLLLVVDAASARHFSCYGYDRDTTPNIDRLAGEGILFERAYTTAPYTRLAMASLWTSQYPDQHHHGVRPRAPLPAHRIVLPELLQRKGIPAWAAIGNVVAGEVSGLARGFSEVRYAFRDREGPRAEVVRRDVEGWLLSEKRGRALFYAHFLEPHFPYDPPPPFDTRFGDGPISPSQRGDRSWFESVKLKRTPMSPGLLDHLVRLYDGNLAYADHEIGLLRDHLEKAGLWDDLVVVLVADHGEQFLEHGAFEHGWHLYDETVKIPLVIRLPGQTEAKRIAEPVDILDLGATLADVFGVLDDARGSFEGRSLLPLLAGGSIPPHRIITRDLTQRPSYSTFDGHLKLIQKPNWGQTELYELDPDPGERHSLAGERPVTTECRRQDLARWLRDLDRGEPGVETEAGVDLETQKALRALGYVN